MMHQSLSFSLFNLSTLSPFPFLTRFTGAHSICSLVPANLNRALALFHLRICLYTRLLSADFRFSFRPSILSDCTAVCCSMERIKRKKKKNFKLELVLLVRRDRVNCSSTVVRIGLLKSIENRSENVYYLVRTRILRERDL